MPKVLHIGPCDTPGGMANVMRTLAEYPPEGWEADLALLPYRWLALGEVACLSPRTKRFVKNAE